MIHVVHVCGELGSYGAENAVARLVQHTTMPDVDASVLTINRWSQPQLRAQMRFPIVAIDRAGRADLAFLGRMSAALRRAAPDVVHTHGHYGRYWGRLAAVLAHVPIVIHTEHNSDLVPPRPRWVFGTLNRLLRDRTTAFVDFTEPRRRALAAAEGIPVDRVVVIPNGVPLAPREPGAAAAARSALGVADNEFAIVAVARLYAPKRLDRAIDALAALPEPMRARARLVMVGDGPLRAELSALAARDGVADRVTFLGHRTDAAALFDGADVALTSSEREAMPLAVIEAMLHRAPIVSTPWDGAAAMLGAGRFGIVAADHAPAAIAAALVDALADPGAARARADAAFAFAAHEYDIDRQARRHAALYRLLLQARGAAQPPPGLIASELQRS